MKISPRLIKFSVTAWLIFAGGITVMFAVDAGLRLRQGNFGQPGLPTPDFIWFGLPRLLGATAIGLLAYSASGVLQPWKGLLFVVVQALAGFVAYLAACLWYVIDTGIDAT